jgi:RNA polymerase sigma-B factor
MTTGLAGGIAAGQFASVRPDAAVPPAGRLDELGNSELLVLAQSRPGADERRAAAREVLVSRHRNLVRSCVARYRRGAEPAEDLMQVGYVGLMKAINRFDPALGVSLAAYAQPTIQGELRRHFRDRRWPVRASRPLQELVLALRAATEDLTHELGRFPADADLAARLAVSPADLRAARLAEAAARPFSLDAPATGGSSPASLAELMGEDDRGIEHMLAMSAIAAHWDEVPAREQTILMLRFHGNLSQAEIGARIGVSQMQVSRLLSHALGCLRPYLLL